MSRSLYIKICIVNIATCICDLLILITVYVIVVCPVRACYGKNKILFYSILFYVQIQALQTVLFAWLGPVMERIKFYSILFYSILFYVQIQAFQTVFISLLSVTFSRVFHP